MARVKLSTKEIEDKAIRYVVDYLEKNGEEPRIVKRGVDIISGNKHIEVKGSMKQETNVRITHQTQSYLEKNNIRENFFIYYVVDMGTDHPKLLIIDNDTYERHKKLEPRWLIQPLRLHKDTGKPELITL